MNDNADKADNCRGHSTQRARNALLNNSNHNKTSNDSVKFMKSDRSFRIRNTNFNNLPLANATTQTAISKSKENM